MTGSPHPWPLWRLVLRTPRLELRPDDDAGVLEVIEEAHHGVHPPEEMPFGVAWTDVPADELGPNMLRYYWAQRAANTPTDCRIHFLVRAEGRVIGTQSVHAVDYPITREISTGSWLGLRHQGHGYGTEMRAAVLMLFFDHLNATAARSTAFADNPRSLAISGKLGYREDGAQILARRGKPANNLRLVVTPTQFNRPAWQLAVTGLAEARQVLGLPPK